MKDSWWHPIVVGTALWAVACAEQTESMVPCDGGGCSGTLADARSGADSGILAEVGPLPDEDAAVEERTVEVGTGVERFEPLTSGQTIALNLGPQGGGRIEGYHIWGAVRTKGFEPRDFRILFTITDAATGTIHARTERIVDLQPEAEGRYVAYAFAPRLADCCLVEGTEINLQAQVVDSAGHAGWDQVTVRAADTCADASSGLSICE